MTPVDDLASDWDETPAWARSEASRPPVVAIDGPAGSGKSTVAGMVAERLGVPHLDTGAYYRAVTLLVLQAGADPSDGVAAATLAADADIWREDGRTWVDGVDVEDAIRGPEVTATVSTVAAHAQVRAALLPQQRAAAASDGAVVEGRDIGTVVLPGADLKVYLTATPQERASRRAQQDGAADLDAVLADVVRRDREDTERVEAPLAVADDAWMLDTTGMTIDEVVGAIVTRVQERRAAATSVPRVAIVGRPNVGKSTLLNRILGRRVAIVEEKPGVTRDRTEHATDWNGRDFIIVDTGGWEHGATGMSQRIVEQAEAAVAISDAVVFVVDVTVGVLDDDERYARLLRKSGIPVLLVANKADSPRHVDESHELVRLGVGVARPISALHGGGVADFLDELVAMLPEVGRAQPRPDDVVARVALVGKPNVGKSSLFNRLVGEERSIVDPVPHTTRDAVDTHLELDDGTWVFVDTAGMRRKYRSGEETEKYSVDRTRAAIEAADLVLFMVDASEPIGEQDQKLAALVRDAGRGVVLVLNKWDLVDEDRRVELEKELDRMLFFAAWAPRVNVSALTGRGALRLLPKLREVNDAYRTRIPTRRLNRWLEEVTGRTPPPVRKGRAIRIKYVTQPQTAPPRFIAFANGPLPPAYRRFLVREIREAYGFPGVPIHLEDRGGSRGPKN